MEIRCNLNLKCKCMEGRSELSSDKEKIAFIVWKLNDLLGTTEERLENNAS